MQSDVIESEVNNLLEQFSDLNNEDLKELLEGDSTKLNTKLDELVNNSSMLKSLQAQKEYIIANNIKMAQFNLNRQSSFEDMKSYVLNLNEESLNLNKEVNNKLDKIKKFYDHYSMESIYALMQTNLQDIEEESEKIANQFLNKEINLDTFLKEYIKRRTEAHLRRIKTERFASLLYNH